MAKEIYMYRVYVNIYSSILNQNNNVQHFNIRFESVEILFKQYMLYYENESEICFKAYVIEH